MGRRPLMGGNWKLNPRKVSDAVGLATEVSIKVSSFAWCAIAMIGARSYVSGKSGNCSEVVLTLLTGRDFEWVSLYVEWWKCNKDTLVRERCGAFTVRFSCCNLSISGPKPGRFLFTSNEPGTVHLAGEQHAIMTSVIQLNCAFTTNSFGLNIIRWRIPGYFELRGMNVMGGTSILFQLNNLSCLLCV